MLKRRKEPYPRKLRLLSLVSVGWCALAFLGSLYGLNIGIPLHDVDVMLIPNLGAGLILGVIVSFWAYSIDSRDRSQPHAGP